MLVLESSHRRGLAMVPAKGSSAGMRKGPAQMAR